MALSQEKQIEEFPPLSQTNIKLLSKIVENFDDKEANKVKDIEKVTNHDVKAIEYYLKQKIEKTSASGCPAHRG